MADDNTFINRRKFTQMVEFNVIHLKLSYMDTIIHLCEENNIELDEVKKFLSPSILANLEAEAMQLNFLPKCNTLDV